MADSDADSMHGHDNNGDDDAVPSTISDEYLAELATKTSAVSWIAVGDSGKITIFLWFFLVRPLKVCKWPSNMWPRRSIKSCLSFAKV